MGITGKHLFYEERQFIDTVLPVYGLAVIIWGLNVIRLSHPPYPEECHDENGELKKNWIWLKMKQNPKVWGFRTVVWVILCIMPIFTKVMNNGVLFFIVFLCVFSLQFADIEGKQQRFKQKEELREKRAAAKKELDPLDRINTFRRMHTAGKI